MEEQPLPETLNEEYGEFIVLVALYNPLTNETIVIWRWQTEANGFHEAKVGNGDPTKENIEKILKIGRYAKRSELEQYFSKTFLRKNNVF